MRRIFAIAKRIITQFRRDHRTLGLLVVAPVLLLSLVGVLIRSSSDTVKLGIVNEDRSELGAKLARELRGDNSFNAREIARANAEDELRRGAVSVVIFLDPDFGRRFSSGGQAEIIVMIEGSNPQNDTAAQQKISAALASALPRAITQINAPGGKVATPLLNLNYRYFYGGSQFDQLDYIAPAYIGIFVFFLVFLLTTLIFLRERSQGTLERLFATPVSRVELVLGYMLGFSVFALLQSLFMLLFTVYVMQVHTVGNLGVIFLVQAVLAIGAINLGIFLSTFARTEFQVIQFIPMVITPQALLGDFIFPLDTMPAILQAVGRVMPITYANQALRAVMIRGDGIEAILPQLAVLSGFAIVMILLSAMTLRREVA
ncbi:MAG: ABC transporter permease [Chloroflexi bacterium]|nr:ABC transporter permease [Chloroflexota bacterium]